MIVTQKYLSTCIIKKKYFFLKSGPNNKECYRIRGFLTQTKKARCLLVDKKCEYKDLFYKNDKSNILNRYKVDDIKNIYFYNLLHFNLLDVLNICKILLHMKSITLYKYNNNVSINIQQFIKDKNKIKEEKRKNSIWQNNSNDLINSLVIFFKKYFQRYKEEKDLFFKLASYQMEKKKKKKKKKAKNISENYVLASQNLMDENIDNKSVKKKGKTNYFKKYIIRGILENTNISIKKKSYVNNIKDKIFLFEFSVDNIEFSLECLYKKVRGIYLLYRNIMYIKINEHYKIPIAVLNIISNINVYYKVMKNYILVNSFFIKYYFKYYLNKVFNLNNMFVQGKKKKKKKEYIFKNMKDNLIYIRQIKKKTTMNNHPCNDKKKEIISTPYYSKGIINGMDFYNILHKNNIKIKRVKIYFNGKLFVSFPICLTYNINNYQFYLNNIKYININMNNLTTNELFIIKDIYLNNKIYFKNNAFCYLNNENIIMSNEMINIDLDYILLFYILYFNDNQNLYIPRVCNPAWPFYSMINENNLVLKKKTTKRIQKELTKKDQKNINSRNILKRVIYKADQNFVNFVF
ncbi:conserved Plasmodium protein, unknown function [Plasmodium gaboni]|uniref:Uncharacterized protein n=1 Tax=Plasmodium gaboni TaxID=647221 RepID=A0ABY1UKQ7_9APIC|nr:conserved Plasmodium protein, unknown function [Plasmodium gaboni]